MPYLFFLLFLLLSTFVIQHINAGTAADCPSGWRFLDACLGNECPNQQEAGLVYYCFMPQDVCCAQPRNPQPAPNNCVDSATNCILFLGCCRSRAYYSCMVTHCRRTCGFCNG